MTMNKLIQECEENGWDWETFESVENAVVLQFWTCDMMMCEYIFDAVEGNIREAYQHIVGFEPKKII